MMLLWLLDVTIVQSYVTIVATIYRKYTGLPVLLLPLVGILFAVVRTKYNSPILPDTVDVSFGL